jgi:hypothetical protein
MTRNPLRGIPVFIGILFAVFTANAVIITHPGGGGGGLIGSASSGDHGSLIINSNGAVTVNATTTFQTLTNWTRSGAGGGTSNNLAAGTIQVTNAGTYLVNAQISFATGEQPSDITYQLFTNGVASGLKTQRDMTANGAFGSCSIVGTIGLTNYSIIDLRYASTGTDRLTNREVQLAVVSVVSSVEAGSSSGVSAAEVTNIVQSVEGYIPPSGDGIGTHNADAAGRVPEFIVNTWNVFYEGETTDFNTYTNIDPLQPNLMRWLTNTVTWFKTNGYYDHGIRAINIDDFWQAPYRVDGKLTWNTNLIPMGLSNYIHFAHTNGFKVYLYTATSTNPCNNIGISSPIDKVYNDIQTMMSWGADGVKFDPCFSDEFFYGYDREMEYQTRYIRLVNQAVSDYNSLVAYTNGTPRSFWIYFPVQVVKTPDFPSQQLTDSMVGSLNSGILNWPLTSYTMGTNYLNSLWITTKLSIDNRKYFVDGFAPVIFSYYRYYFTTGNGSLDATNLPSVLALHQAVRSPFMGCLGTIPAGTITNSSFADAQQAQAVQGPYMTNKTFLRIFRDPSFDIAWVAHETNNVKILPRKLLDPTPAARSIALVNFNPVGSGTTNTTVTWKHFEGEPGTVYDLENVWTGAISQFTNEFVGSSVAQCVSLYKVTESVRATSTTTTQREEYQIISPRVVKIGGAGAAFNSTQASPFNAHDGINQSNADAGALSIAMPPIPLWASNAVYAFETYSTATNGPVLWTNTWYPYFYSTNTRIGYVQSSYVVSNNPGVKTWHTNTVYFTDVYYPAVTNCLKEVQVLMGASSNNSSRHIIGPIYATYR